MKHNTHVKPGHTEPAIERMETDAQEQGETPAVQREEARNNTERVKRPSRANDPKND